MEQQKIQRQSFPQPERVELVQMDTRGRVHGVPGPSTLRGLQETQTGRCEDLSSDARTGRDGIEPSPERFRHPRGLPDKTEDVSPVQLGSPGALNSCEILDSGTNLSYQAPSHRLPNSQQGREDLRADPMTETRWLQGRLNGFQIWVEDAFRIHLCWWPLPLPQREIICPPGLQKIWWKCVRLPHLACLQLLTSDRNAGKHLLRHASPIKEASLANSDSWFLQCQIQTKAHRIILCLLSLLFRRRPTPALHQLVNKPFLWVPLAKQRVVQLPATLLLGHR